MPTPAPTHMPLIYQADVLTHMLPTRSFPSFILCSSKFLLSNILALPKCLFKERYNLGR